MIARAQKKARKAGVDVSFKNAYAQSLPFPEARFDVVVTTVMLHHLPKKARADLANEIRRVLKPGGRVLAIDFSGTPPKRKTLPEEPNRNSPGRIRTPLVSTYIAPVIYYYLAVAAFASIT
jgi:ubiquinone/menaquinone biosynthesis C-methylase UbiE